MSAGITGTQTHTTNEKNPHSSGSSSSGSGQPHTQQHGEGGQPHELQPDRPPQAQAASEEGKPKRPRGFAAMDRKLVSEIARKGGKAAHSAGTAHEFTSEEARVAGRKGGRATHAKRRKLVEDQAPSKPEQQPQHEEKQGEQ